ncbi:MAG: hypothetical protein H0V45_06635 [Actinobacteria bacterium]|nr:hypothetical protein [Actinomycetota bacterium]
MSAIATPLARDESPALRAGSGLMALAAVGFIGYAVIYLATGIFVAGAVLAGKALLEQRA